MRSQGDWGAESWQHDTIVARMQKVSKVPLLLQALQKGSLARTISHGDPRVQALIEEHFKLMQESTRLESRASS